MTRTARHDVRRFLRAFGMSAVALGVGVRVQAQPVNDDCTTATVIGVTSFNDTVDARSATTGPSFPAFCGCLQKFHDVWYAFTPAESSTVTLNASMSTYLVELDVFSGACTSPQ